MRYVRYLFLAILAVALIVIALANSQEVTLKALPEGLAQATGYSWSLPLFVVVFGGILAGLLIGFFWEWLREHKHRAEASRRRGEVKKLEAELARMKGDKAKAEGDEVLALLDEAS